MSLHISKGKRGRAGTWKTRRLPKKTIIHINGNNIKQNIKKSPEERKPVIAIKGAKNIYAKALEIPYPCRIVYQPDKPLSCGARVWIEVLGYDLVSIQPSSNIQ